MHLKQILVLNVYHRNVAQDTQKCLIFVSIADFFYSHGLAQMTDYPYHPYHHQQAFQEFSPLRKKLDAKIFTYGVRVEVPFPPF